MLYLNLQNIVVDSMCDINGTHLCDELMSIRSSLITETDNEIESLYVTNFIKHNNIELLCMNKRISM